MEENKLPHSIIGTVLSWTLTILAWTVAHIGFICGALAIISTIYSIRASRETIKLRKKQQIREDSKDNRYKYPDTDM